MSAEVRQAGDRVFKIQATRIGITLDHLEVAQAHQLLNRAGVGTRHPQPGAERVTQRMELENMAALIDLGNSSCGEVLEEARHPGDAGEDPIRQPRMGGFAGKQSLKEILIDGLKCFLLVFGDAGPQVKPAFAIPVTL